jgi:hypothetical protein
MWNAEVNNIRQHSHSVSMAPPALQRPRPASWPLRQHQLPPRSPTSNTTSQSVPLRAQLKLTVDAVDPPIDP